MASIAYVQVEHVELTARDQARLLRDALRKTAENRRLVTLGDHFKVNAKTAPGGAYGYERRSPRYLERKQRRYGHQRPLELTGRLKRYVRNNSVVRATQYRSTLQIKSYFPLNAQRRKELEASSAADDQADALVGQQYFAREAPKRRRQRRRRV